MIMCFPLNDPWPSRLKERTSDGILAVRPVDVRAGFIMWDAVQYLKYSDERSRPFFDLLARVKKEDADLIVDLGCGPGNLTRTLIDRWPTARVVGVENSPEMLARAKPLPIQA